MEISVKVTARPQIVVPALSVSDMKQVGEFADTLITRRVDSGSPRGVSGDAPKPLSKRFAALKEKKGLRPVRDLHYTGLMLEEMGAYEARKGYVYVGFKSTENYMKALKNQKRFEWFGLSGQEEQQTVAKADDLFAQRAAAMSAGTFGMTT